MVDEWSLKGIKGCIALLKIPQYFFRSNWIVFIKHIVHKRKGLSETGFVVMSSSPFPSIKISKESVAGRVLGLVRVNSTLLPIIGAVARKASNSDSTLGSRHWSL